MIIFAHNRSSSLTIVFSPFLCALQSACAALPVSTTRSAVLMVKIGIFRRVRMTLRAMRSSLPEWDSPLDVHFWGDNFQMIRTNAGSVPTKMVDLQSFRDWPNQQFVNYAMCIKLLAAHSEFSIPRDSFSSNPGPAFFRWSKLDFFADTVGEIINRHADSMDSDPLNYN